MRIGIDIDGVMCDFFTPANEWMADFLETAPQKVDREWDWYRQYGPTGKRAWKALWQFIENNPQWWTNLSPMPGSLLSVRWAAMAGHEVVFITNRNDRYRVETERWLDFCLNRSWWVELRMGKGSKYHDDIDLYVDDSPVVLEDLARKGKPAIRLEYKYNEGALAWCSIPGMEHLPNAVETFEDEQAWQEDHPEQVWPAIQPSTDPENSALTEAHGLVHGDRNASYGHPYDDYSRSVGIFREWTGIEMTPSQGAMFMMAVKMSRLIESPDKRDNIVDLAGYAECYRMIRQMEGADGGHRVDGDS